mmetsp:Transcript_7275/g.26378  ORF Transcript_7275/g.26378 Transcript_7275/m.26378 type:complete len:433 (+) Transcript_7275:65-1363(+)
MPHSPPGVWPEGRPPRGPLGLERRLPRAAHLWDLPLLPARPRCVPALVLLLALGSEEEGRQHEVGEGHRGDVHQGVYHHLLRLDGVRDVRRGRGVLRELPDHGAGGGPAEVDVPPFQVSVHLLGLEPQRRDLGLAPVPGLPQLGLVGLGDLVQLLQQRRVVRLGGGPNLLDQGGCPLARDPRRLLDPPLPLLAVLQDHWLVLGVLERSAVLCRTGHLNAPLGGLPDPPGGEGRPLVPDLDDVLGHGGREAHDLRGLPLLLVALALQRGDLAVELGDLPLQVRDLRVGPSLLVHRGPLVLELLAEARFECSDLGNKHLPLLDVLVGLRKSLRRDLNQLLFQLAGRRLVARNGGLQRSNGSELRRAVRLHSILLWRCCCCGGGGGLFLSERHGDPRRGQHSQEHSQVCGGGQEKASLPEEVWAASGGVFHSWSQ